MTGYEWTIYLDGKWSKARIAGANTGTQKEPIGSGMLEPQRLKKLEAAISAADFASLPKQIGEAPKVNAQTYSLEANGRFVRLQGVSSRGAKDLATQIRKQQGVDRDLPLGMLRFLDLMQAVETAVADDK